MSGLVRRAHGVVVDWTLHVVRGLPKPVAEDRFQQIVSDLWEQEHAAPRQGPALAASLLLRLVRGLPADLAWRREALAEAPPIVLVEKAWRPLQADGHPFDQTNGIVALSPDHIPHGEPDPGRHMFDRGMAAVLMTGFFSGGGI